jgi:uncharacterized protein (UPF0179 family)
MMQTTELCHVEQRPLMPLTMGHPYGVVHVREARK